MTPRRRLLRWVFWFTAVHTGLLAVIGFRYLWLYFRLSPTVASIYGPVAFVGHVAALAYLPTLLLIVPLALLLPWARLVVPLAVAVASVGAAFLMLDSLVFAENRYHLGILTATLLAPQTWMFLGIYFVLGLAIEGMLARLVWRHTEVSTARWPARLLAWGLIGCFVAGHLMHAWFEARYDVAVTSFTRYLPLYFPLRDSKVQVRLGLVDRAAARERGVVEALARHPAGELQYPLNPLRLLAGAAAAQRAADRHRRDAGRRAQPAVRAAHERVRPRDRPASTPTTAGATPRAPACSPSSTGCPRPTGTPSPASRGLRC